MIVGKYMVEWTERTADGTVIRRAGWEMADDREMALRHLKKKHILERIVRVYELSDEEFAAMRGQLRTLRGPWRYPRSTTARTPCRAYTPC